MAAKCGNTECGRYAQDLRNGCQHWNTMLYQECGFIEATESLTPSGQTGFAGYALVKNYRKKGVQPMRPYVPGEDLTSVSVSDEDTPELGGMIAIGTDNEARWYVSKRFFAENYIEA